MPAPRSPLRKPNLRKQITGYNVTGVANGGESAKASLRPLTMTTTGTARIILMRYIAAATCPRSSQMMKLIEVVLLRRLHMRDGNVRVVRTSGN